MTDTERSAAVVMTYPGRNQNVLAWLRALEDAGMLGTYCTTVASQRAGMLAALLPRALRQELARRDFSPIDPAHIACFPFRKLVQQAALRLGASWLTARERGWASDEGVSLALDRKVARRIASGKLQATAVYGFDYCARRTFEAARRRGMRRFFELTTGYWRAAKPVFDEERVRNPEWAVTLENIAESAAKFEHKDEELALAEHVIVPSSHVRDTLALHPGFTATIDVIPYGAPATASPARRARPPGMPLRALYVGSLTQQKGLSYLFEAMRLLGDSIALTVVGGRSSIPCAVLDHALARHRWLGQMPHERVIETMAEHDVFVFPSLFEGSALVILEALSRGLPVVTTLNAGPMAVEDGSNGFIVPIRDAEAVASRLALLAGDRERLAAMSEAARGAAERMSWQRQEAEFLRVIRARMGLSD